MNTERSEIRSRREHIEFYRQRSRSKRKQIILNLKHSSNKASCENISTQGDEQAPVLKSLNRGFKIRTVISPRPEMMVHGSIKESKDEISELESPRFTELKTVAKLQPSPYASGPLMKIRSEAPKLVMPVRTREKRFKKRDRSYDFINQDPSIESISIRDKSPEKG